MLFNLHLWSYEVSPITFSTGIFNFFSPCNLTEKKKKYNEILLQVKIALLSCTMIKIWEIDTEEKKIQWSTISERDDNKIWDEFHSKLETFSTTPRTLYGEERVVRKKG